MPGQLPGQAKLQDRQASRVAGPGKHKCSSSWVPRTSCFVAARAGSAPTHLSPVHQACRQERGAGPSAGSGSCPQKGGHLQGRHRDDLNWK